MFFFGIFRHFYILDSTLELIVFFEKNKLDEITNNQKNDYNFYVNFLFNFEINIRLQWDFHSAFFFAGTVATTIGKGCDSVYILVFNLLLIC